MKRSGDVLHGRDHELLALLRFVEGDAGDDAALILTGAAGAGKTALWEAGCALAADRGHRVMVTRARDAEASLAFAGLGDLLDGVDPAVGDLPAPQRTAIDVALLRAEPDGPAPEPRAVGVALLGILRSLAADGPVLVAVDDIQWLDAPSADALTFASRRLKDADVRVLLTERSGVGTPSTGIAGTTRIEVGSLAAVPLGNLLRDRLGLRLRQPMLLDLYGESQGNPLFALEVGRILSKQGVPRAGERLPHPQVVEDLVDTHLAELSPDIRRVVLAVALSARPRRSELEGLVGEEALHAALLEGVLAADGDRLRPAHPLLGAAAVRAASPAQQRATHADLAGVAADDHRRARHLALAAEGPDEQLAAYLAGAAGRAAARGAPDQAIALAEQALRLCPPDAATRANRVLELADHLARAGRSGRLVGLLSDEQPALQTPTDRARAHLLLADGAHVPSIDAFEAQIEQALAEDATDADVRTRALARRSTAVAIGQIERLAEAEDWAIDACDASVDTWPDLQHEALHALAWVRALRGVSIGDLAEQAAELDDGPADGYRSVDRIVAMQLGWSGEVDAARERFAALTASAKEGSWASDALRLEVVALELRAGDCAAAALALDPSDDDAGDIPVMSSALARCRALLAATMGDPRETEHWAGEAIAGAGRNGIRWDLLESWRALGLGALAAGDPEAAVEHLWPVWEHTLEHRVDEPGAFPVATDLAEALVAVDRIDDAAAVVERLAGLAQLREHPWALISAGRGAALIELAQGADEDAAALALAGAAEDYARHGLRHDSARTLLALGRTQRRRRKWGDARRALEESAAAFAAASADGWEAVARAELERVGARRPRADPDELTPAERRVVELAAAGHANKAIAQSLVVTISTVEAHLTRAYGKLGVRSRTQLAERIGWSKSGGFTD